MKKLIIIQTAAPDYRREFFKEITHELDKRFELYSGTRYFEKSVVTDSAIPLILCKNYFFLGRRFLWQTGVLHLLFSEAVLVLEMNPRIVSNWIFLIFRKIAGKKTVLWGHAWPRKGSDSPSDGIRNLMRHCASSIITYTQKQKEELQQKMPHKVIAAAPNALYSKDTMFANITGEVPKNFIYVGRLTQGKKALFMLRAFHKALPVLPQNAHLIVVGEGEQKEVLQNYIDQHKLEEKVYLKGHISDVNVLRDLYTSSICSISPGYVGLSVTQSFGFGVPMLVSKNENHSPEIEAVKDGENAIFFETDDLLSFRESLLHFIENASYWTGKRDEIRRDCIRDYSVESMAKVFINLVNRNA